MAHLERIETHVCLKCSKRATERLVNRYNATVAYYCASHAEKALEDFRASETWTA